MVAKNTSFNPIVKQSLLKTMMSATADPFFTNKARGNPVGSVSHGFKDLLFIAALEEVFDEKYLTYMKKSNKKDTDKQLAKSKQDFYVALTKAVNATDTTTPMDPGSDQKCKIAKNYVASILRNTDKLIDNKSGIRDTKNVPQICFTTKYNNICIDEQYVDAWTSFYGCMERLVIDDPAKNSAFKSTSDIRTENFDLSSKIDIKADALKLAKTAPEDISIAKNIDLLTKSILEDDKRAKAAEMREQAEHEMKMRLYAAQIKQLEQ